MFLGHCCQRTVFFMCSAYSGSHTCLSVLVFSCCITNSHKRKSLKQSLSVYYVTVLEIRRLGQCGWVSIFFVLNVSKGCWSGVGQAMSSSKALGLFQALMVVGQIQFFAGVELKSSLTC